jgi:predicted transcriptional regulator/energy-coupling factor transporter ATP-binding protein EcfA2
MHTNPNSSMDASSKFKEYKIIFNEAKKAKLETLSTWYSLFNLREDPFSADIKFEDFDFFVNQQEIVKSLIFDIGVAARNIPIMELLVGPPGSGKSTILSYIHYVTNRLSREDSSFNIKGNYVSVEELLEDDDSAEYESEQKLFSESRKNYNYFLFDDATHNHISRIKELFVHTQLKLFSTTPTNLLEIMQELDTKPNVFYVRPLTLKDAKEMLDRRITYSLFDVKTKITVDEIFDAESIKIMHKYCFGLPKLILKCASACLQSLAFNYKRDRTEISKHKVSVDIAEEACKSVKCYHAYRNYDELSEHKMVIINKIIDIEKTPTEISSDLKKDRTTISRHLSELHDLGLVKLETRGRESRYRATEAVRILKEIRAMPKEVWTNG